MSIIVKIGTFFLNILFSLMKLLPVQKKITYISRQMNKTPLDFQMIEDCFKNKNQDYKHIILAKMIPDGIIGKIGYCFHMLKQMYHIATSKIVILDTYCLLVSLLNQRDSLIVIQMWHALGAFKKFGYSILDQEEGSSSRLAHLMKMHHNYTYVLSSSEYAASFFAEAFHVSMDKMKIYPLPKTDLLLNKNETEKVINHIYDIYPQLKTTKEKIVYAPTFRKTNEQHLYRAIKNLIREIDFDKYELILKTHPLTTFKMNDSRIIEDNVFDSLQFFHVADVIITDYSAVLFEALMLNKPIYFYAFDFREYVDKRSFYIDYKQMPGLICYQAQDLMNAIENENIDLKKIESFKKLMVSPYQLSYTEDFVDFLIGCIKEKK